MSDLIRKSQSLDEWKEDFKGFVERLNIPRDDYKGIMAYIDEVPSAEPEQHGRIFQEIVVEYPSISIYPEYEGKPYFSIKYVEDGQGYIGYGTYNPEVLSEYLKKYFMPSAESEPKPISYMECANAMLKMWIDNVLTDGEYNRIMEKLNSKHMTDMRGE